MPDKNTDLRSTHRHYAPGPPVSNVWIFMQIQRVTRTWLLSCLFTPYAVFLKNFFTQHDFLRNKRDLQLNHVLITTYQYVLHFKQLLEFMKVVRFRQSITLITVCLETQDIFFLQFFFRNDKSAVSSKRYLQHRSVSFVYTHSLSGGSVWDLMTCTCSWLHVAEVRMRK